MYLFHSANHVPYVLNHVNSSHLAERVVAEWKGKLVQIRYYVRPRIQVAIDADRAGILVDAAADIENRQFSRTGRA